MNHEHQVSLNFFSFKEQNFQFTVYRKPYGGESSEDSFKDCKKQKLPVGGPETEYQYYWVSIDHRDDFEPITCASITNNYVTSSFLYYLLEKKCGSNLQPSDYFLDDGFYKRVYFILDQHKEGKETVWLEPYFLKSKNQFGFLIDFEFSKAKDISFGRRVLQLSLSLDKNGRDNRDFYVNRFEKVQQFISKFYKSIFPLELNENNKLDIEENLKKLTAPHLNTKTYVFQEGENSNSQFMGIRSYGPLHTANNNTLLFFLYHHENKPYSYDLYRALRGDTYPTFPGMEKMFSCPLGKQHVSGMGINEFNEKDIDNVIGKINEVSSNGNTVIPIIIVPWSKSDSDEESDNNYYRLKHKFLSHNLPTQFVSLSTLKNKNILKWSISNIGLGIFSKMGGQPWKVQPQNDKCLIIGIGQSHRFNQQGTIERYFAYSVLTDSSGLYKELRVLGRSNKEHAYLEELQKNLLNVLEEYTDRFEKFAIHTTFKPRFKEMDAIQKVLDVYSENTSEPKELVVLKFNSGNKFFGYDLESNSMVPYESTYIVLSYSEYLIWFEGLQYHNPGIKKKIGRPVHVEFIYPKNGLSEERKESYLQDAVNLSGANWRGFNAKSLPISVYYAQLIARYVKEFNRLGLEDIELNELTPWFL